MSTNLRVMIVGGGIGGLATAIALHQAGIDTTVFESADNVQAIQVGAGLALWGNAVRALHLIGLDKAALGVSSRLARLTTRSWRGRVVSDWRVGEIADRHGGFWPIGISRPDLHRVLLGGIDDRVLRLGSRFTRFEQADSGVTVHLADGSTDRGDVLVGADGIRSLVRAQLHGAEEPRYSGQTSWRAMVTVPYDVPPAFQLFMGPSALVALYPVGGARPYWLAAARAPQGGQDPQGGGKRAVLERYRGWTEEVRSVFEATEAGAINRTDIVDHPPLERWGEGRVTLLGDAAHAMTMHQGQGAGTTLEDAFVFARALREHSDAVSAVRDYERNRIARTTPLVNGSLRFGSFYTLVNPVAAMLRNTIFGLRSRRGVEKAESKLLEFV